MPTMEDQAQVAQLAIDEYEAERERYAQFVAREAELEAGRPAAKSDAIMRIMQGLNPLNQKSHSASSAEAIVETDHGYHAYLTVQREVVLAKNLAYSKSESAKLRAELGIAMVRATAGAL